MDLNDLLYYNSSWRIIVCTVCSTVPQTDLYRHIRHYHDPMRAYKLAAIKSLVQAFDYLPLYKTLMRFTNWFGHLWEPCLFCFFRCL